MSISSDIIKKPLDVIQKLFEEGRKSNDSSWERSDWGVKKHFSEAITNAYEEVQIEESDLTFQIPLIDSQSIRNVANGQLIRYRGMVQDMFDPEYYLGIYQQSNPGTGEKVRVVD